MRVAIVIDGLAVPAWVHRAIHGVENIDGVTVTYFLSTAACAASNHVATRLPGALALYFAADQRAFGGGDPDAAAGVKIESDRPVIDIEINNGYAELPAAVQRQQASNLDLVLNLSSSPVGTSLSNLSRYGTIELRFGDDNNCSLARPMLRAMLGHPPTIRSSAVLLSQSHEHPQCVFESVSAAHTYSLFRTQNPVLWKISQFPAVLIRRLQHFGELLPVASRTDGGSAGADIVRSTDHLGLVARLCWRYLATKLGGGLPRYHWKLLLSSRSGKRAIVRMAGIPGFTAADPFIDCQSGHTGVFFELMRLGSGKADIAYSELDDAGNLSSPKTVLSRPYHLSYPQIIRWQGEIYMLPETKSNRSIEIYRATEYPLSWTFEKTLIADILAVDSTIFEWDGRLWMFSCVGIDGGSTRDDLHLYYCDSLLGDWRPHPLNPVVSDVTTARPAGNVFKAHGKLLRPSQDNAERYGYAVVFNEILELTTEQYSERVVARVEPSDIGFGLAVHTYNRTAEFAIFDLAVADDGSATAAELRFSSRPVDAAINHLIPGE